LTDYPDTDLISNMEHNITTNFSVADRNRISVQASPALVAAFASTITNCEV
jgi:hypothetical protein